MLNKKLFIVLVFWVSILSSIPASVYAQQSVTSNPVVTRVGEAPLDQKPLVSPTPGASTQPGQVQGIIEWASQITNGLQKAWQSLLNKLPITISNGSYSAGPCPPNCVQGIYWCTHLIVDAYRLAGYEGMDRNALAGVVNMRKWWKTSALGLGYKYVDYENDKQSIVNVQPGYAMFMERVSGSHTDDEHVNLVKEITVNSDGSGDITTIDSNSSSISHRYPVRNWEVKNVPYPVRGFGGV